MSPNIAIVILAAGASSRMGVPKQLLPWGNNSLLNHVIHTACTLDHQVHVVLGAHGARIKKEIPEIVNLHAHINPKWKEGIGNSIAFAMTKLMDVNLDGVLFLLGDQPFVSASYLMELLSCFKGNSTGIIVSEFYGNLGVPAVFSSAYFKELSTLSTDVGAKSIIKTHPKKVLKLNAEAYVRDIDTLADYRKAHQIMFGN